MKQLWVEQYRPNTIDGYVFVDDAQREQVETWIQEGSIPHLLLSGPAGTGKTTLAKLLINELGIDEYDTRWDAIFGRDLENTQPTPEPHQNAQDETTLGRTVPPQHN